jgi:hypothetical protein
MATKIINTAFLIALLTSPPASLAGEYKGSPRFPYSATQYLKNYGLTSCLAEGLVAKEAKKDAEDAAVAYFELGGFGVQAYREVAEAGRQHLAKQYLSRDGEKLVTMRCLDFFHGKALDQLVKKHLKAQRQRPHE